LLENDPRVQLVQYDKPARLLNDPSGHALHAVEY
jgi:hypothetical protein